MYTYWGSSYCCSPGRYIGSFLSRVCIIITTNYRALTVPALLRRISTDSLAEPDITLIKIHVVSPEIELHIL
jgi:hypothetical protein